MIDRAIREQLLQSWSEAPVVIMSGGRQVGKTTLARSLLASGELSGSYVTLDDLGSLAAARQDPEDFLRGLDRPVVIDEVQRVPELLLVIKKLVDEQRAPGQFLLTGSSNLGFFPEVADALVGRMREVTLWPLTQAEIHGHPMALVDRLFQGKVSAASPCWRCGALRASSGACPMSCSAVTDTLALVLKRVLRGGFPEMVTAGFGEAGRNSWARSYADTLIRRDLRDISRTGALSEISSLVRLLAARTGSLTRYSKLASDLSISQPTAKRWVDFLRQLYLVHPLPAWSRNLGKRLVKAPKLHFVDCGLAANLLRVDARRLREEDALRGALIETFATMELLRQAEVSWTRPVAYHYRTQSGREIDLILEDATGKIVAIEIKSGALVRPRDMKAMIEVRDELGDAFRAGIVLTLGDTVTSLAENIRAVPMSVLWSSRAQHQEAASARLRSVFWRGDARR